MRRFNIKMIRLLAIMAIVLITGLKGHTQDRDGTMTIDDTLFVQDVFKYHDTIIPVNEITYHQFSTNGSTWTRDTTGANWVRFSNDIKTSWWQLPYSAFENYWQVSNDSLLTINGYLVVVDSLYSSVHIDTDLYKQGGDSLTVTDLDGKGGAEGQALVNRSGKPVWEEFPAGVGETNTSNNAGLNGVGVYDNKDGVKFNFRNIDYDSDSLITAILNAPDSTIELGFDGTKRYIASGVMLANGGDLSVSRTIDLDIDGGVASSDVDPATDYIASYDVSAGAHRKVLISDMLSSDTLAYVDSIYANNVAPFPIDMLSYDKEGVSYDVTEIPKADGIYSGGRVTWRSGLIFDISPCAYYIDGIFYTTITEAETLSTADPTNPRIDILVVDTASTVQIVAGTPSANPQKPTADPEYQIELTSILVNAGASTPTPPDGGTVVDSIVYNENVEWTASASGVVVDFNSTAEAYVGSVSADVGTINGGDIIKFISSPDVPLEFENLTFFIKLKTTLQSGYRMYVQLYFDNVDVTKPVLVRFDNSTTDWQNLSLPFSDFILNDVTFDEVRFSWYQRANRADASGFYLDYVKLQTGYAQPPVVGGVDLYVNDTLRETGITKLNLIEGNGIDVTYAPSGNVTIGDNGGITTFSTTSCALNPTTQTLGAVVNMAGNTTFTLSGLVADMTGNVTVNCAATAHTFQFAGYTTKVSPSLESTGGVITTTGSSAVDCYSWWYDGTILIVNGTKNYD